MKSLSLELQDGICDCLIDLLDRTPSTELEKVQKEQYGWSDETYQKLLAFYQTIQDIGAVVSDGKKGNGITVMSVYNTNGSKETNDLILLKMCNFLGVRFSHCELKNRGPQFANSYPNEVFAHFRDPITPTQREKLVLMIEGFCLR